MDASARRGRRNDSRGRYLIHVLTPAGAGLDSACRKLGSGPSTDFTDQEPDHLHPLCQPCVRANAQSRLPSVRPVVVRAATPKPQPAPEPPPSPLLCHRMVWAAHALGSASRIAIVHALRQASPRKLDQLREDVGQWDGMFDLCMDALVRGRVVAIEGKRASLTDLGRALYEHLAIACAAGLPGDEPPAPTHLY